MLSSCNLTHCVRMIIHAKLFSYLLESQTSTTIFSDDESSEDTCTCTCKNDMTTTLSEGNQELVGQDENVCSCKNENDGPSGLLTIIIYSSVIVAIFAIVGLLMFVCIRKWGSNNYNAEEDNGSSSKYLFKLANETKKS